MEILVICPRTHIKKKWWFYCLIVNNIFLVKWPEKLTARQMYMETLGILMIKLLNILTGCLRNV
ncbi:MAG: hypothetical protein NTU69_12135 [Proteobacteria bacterium]|nr:hypothetical protein [Pseudomonadota bacterium]